MLSEEIKKETMLHPAYRVVNDVENSWSRDSQQAWSRTRMIVRALAEAGIIGGGELIEGFYRVKRTEPAQAEAAG